MTSRAGRREQLLVKALFAIACQFRRDSWLLTASKGFTSSWLADFARFAVCGQLVVKALLAVAWQRGREAFERITVSKGFTHSCSHMGPRCPFVTPSPSGEGGMPLNC